MIASLTPPPPPIMVSFRPVARFNCASFLDLSSFVVGPCFLRRASSMCLVNSAFVPSSIKPPVRPNNWFAGAVPAAAVACRRWQLQCAIGAAVVNSLRRRMGRLQVSHTRYTMSGPVECGGRGGVVVVRMGAAAAVTGTAASYLHIPKLRSRSRRTWQRHDQWQGGPILCGATSTTARVAGQ